MLAYLEDGTWSRWNDQPRPLNGEGSYQLPRDAETIYSAEELAAYGLVAVTPAEVPEGKVMVSSSIVDQDGAPIEVGVFEDVPDPEPLHTTPKDLIWRRATDQEAEAMELALAAQPIRLRRIYEGATQIDDRDELYAMLLGALTVLFGVERANELLEPTE